MIFNKLYNKKDQKLEMYNKAPSSREIDFEPSA
jgi:hypothetical protein